jgi:hypothetical protein
MPQNRKKKSKKHRCHWDSENLNEAVCLTCDNIFEQLWVEYELFLGFARGQELYSGIPKKDTLIEFRKMLNKTIYYLNKWEKIRS